MDAEWVLLEEGQPDSRHSRHHSPVLAEHNVQATSAPPASGNGNGNGNGNGRSAMISDRYRPS
ncbi:MAG: hypothetical protein U1G07_05445 [Verrucomicrobiota bacterium]